MREPMVTRTIKTTEVTVLAVNVEQGEACNETLTVSRTYSDDKKLLKVLKETFDTDTFKVVSIIDKHEVETLYGVTEQEFITFAKVLDAETRKPLIVPDAE